MNLKNELSAEHSKAQTIRLADYIGDDTHKFATLMDLFLQGEYRITQRSAWVVGYLGQKYPQLLAPYWAKVLRYCQGEVPDAVKRNVLRILEDVSIPEHLEGELVDWCFKILETPQEAGAIRAFAMTVAYNICRKYPELAQELKSLIETFMPEEKPSFVSRGRKIIKALDKMY
jgi:hypothetical protein